MRKKRPLKLRKINLGSGIHTVKGWINIDKSWNIYLSKFPTIKKILYKLKVISEGTFKAKWRGKSIMRHDVTKDLPFESESIDVVYTSHLLEHLTYNEARNVCRETHRVLKKGGIFRVVVPDLKLYAMKYVEGNKKFFGSSEKPIANLFLESLHLDALTERPKIEKILYASHKYLYDAESLIFLIKSSGFSNIQEHGFRKGFCPDLEKIENRKRSIYIEAIK